MQGHGTHGLQVQSELLDGEEGDDQETVLAGPVHLGNQKAQILAELGLDKADEPKSAVHEVPANIVASIPPNVPANGTPPYRTYQLALVAALALTCGTTRYFVTGSDASGSDTLTASTVPSVPKPPVQPVDLAFEAAKRVAEADLKSLNGFAYTPECERLVSSTLGTRQAALIKDHKKITHEGLPHLTVPAHVDFGVASLGQKESVLCWIQHPGFTHP